MPAWTEGSDTPAPESADEVADDVWEGSFQALQLFVAKRGTARVASRAVAGRILIGAWVLEQRERFWAGNLTSEQRARLEQLPEWTWSGPAEAKWRRGLNTLRRYAEHRGTTAVPVGVVIGEVRLGEWVAAQRAGHAGGRMPPSNALLLEEVPGWQWVPDTDRWELGLAAARAYVDSHDSIEGAADAVVDGFPLGNWLQICRIEYREGRLSPKQVAALTSLPGWRWLIAEERWDQGLRALHAYAAAHGHANPLQGAVQDGFPIGQWAHDRRREGKRGALRPDRAAALESLPGWTWDIQGSRWRTGYEHLQRYVARFGHAHPPVATVLTDYPLGSWVQAQRRAHVRGRLSLERTAALEALPGWLWHAR